jgi:hypothetical protein
MPLNYTTYQTALSTALAIPTTDTQFQNWLPNCIAYAEGRIYRDLNMLTEDVRDSSSSTTANVRNFTLPTSIGTFQVITDINIITPASTAPESGTRIRLLPSSLAFLDWTTPSSAGTGVPTNWAYITQSLVAGQNQIVFGPWPDNTYTVEVIGKIIPTPLSSGNTTTFLTLYLEDLFLAASMVSFTGYMKNYGSQADDPKMATSWDAQYNLLLKSASDWEARKRFAGASWTAFQVEPTALPQRG